MHNYFLIGKRLSLKRLLIILITWPLRRGFVTKINIFKTFYNLRWVCYNLRQLFKFYNLRQPVFTFYDSFGTDCFLHFTTGLLQFTTVITIYDKFITIYDSFYNLRQFLQFTTAQTLNCSNFLFVKISFSVFSNLSLQTIENRCRWGGG